MLRAAARIPPGPPPGARPCGVGAGEGEGHSINGIAEALFITPRTVEAHISEIFLKFSLDTEPGTNRRFRALLAHLKSATCAPARGG